MKRYSLFGRGEYEIGGGITAYAQGLYARTKATNIGSEPVMAAPWDIEIPVTNPFIPADVATLLASRPNPTAPMQYFGRPIQVGPRTFTTTTKTWQALAGLKGEFAPGYTWDISASHGETSTVDQTISGAISTSALRRLVNAADGGKSLCSGGYNPFGTDELSADCVAYVSRTPRNSTTIKQDVIEATAQGGLLRLPAGEARFAVNGQYRRNSYLFVPDADVASGDISSVSATQRTSGVTAVKEIGAELLLPVLAGIPAFQSFNVTLGYRYSDYRISGGASTYKADFDWRIVKPLMLRGGYQRALRAPNIGEFFLAGNQTVTAIGNPPGGGDPCDTRSNFRASSNADAAKVRALCIATGLNAALVDSFRHPSQSIVTNTYGNQSLKPETADTYTIGAVLTSPFDAPALRSINLSVDYYNIRIKDAIAPLGALTSLQKCFNGDGSNPNYDPTNYFCTLFTRAANGIFTAVQQPYLNLGGYRTAGIDAQLSWRIPVAALGGQGAVTLSSYVNYLDKFAIQTLPGGAFQDNAGTISASTSYPRWKHVESMTVQAGRFGITGRWRHISAMRDSSTVTNPSSTTAGAPAYDYFDVSATLRVNDRFELRGGVNNLTDKDPPIIGGTSGVTNTGVYDVVGRSLYVALKGRF